ncbi:hypothetical protein [Enhydrobacter aerosaccus]|nr:hypothetical protein [Enhydrobacter aerosaccus]
MTEDELQARLDATIVAEERYGLVVEECGDQEVRLRFPERPRAWTMPALLAALDASLRAAAGADAEVTHLALTVLRPVQQADIVTLSRVLRRDRDTIHAETWLFSHAPIQPILHATATLSASA